MSDFFRFCVFFFFFKQKTAYEMRISDWSSDVCSSDLLVLVAGTLRPILEPDKREARVLAAAAEVEAADREYRLHGLLLVVQQIFADLAQRFVGVRDGRAGRRGDLPAHEHLILVGRERLGDTTEHPDTKRVVRGRRVVER